VEEYHNPCAAWRQRLSPYLKGTVNGKCDPTPPLKIRGVPPKAGRCYELIKNLRKKWRSWKWELKITSYELQRIIKLSNREIMHCALSIIHWLLGRCPKPHILFCLDAKKYAKKIKTASPHRPDSCLFAKRQITRRLAAAQTACLLPDGTLSAQIGCPDEEMRSGE
jgi:hypothetical protein